MIGLVGVIAILLAIPMPDSLKSQVSSLIGIVISAVLALSSATFIGNALAGIMLRTINNFKSGDFIHINNIFGRVTERGLFHTEIQTETRDLMTLPNMFLATNPVKVTRASGTFIDGTVSLGYDVNQALIKEVMIKAAKDVGLEDPFVRIIELGDFSIVYRVYGLLKDAKTMLTAKSKLNGALVDRLHNANIEIVSPSFMNQRAVGDTVFIPKKMYVKKNAAEEEKAEEIIFDKADEAENIEKNKLEISTIDDRIKSIEQELKTATEDQITLLESEKKMLYLKLQAIQETIDKKIDEISDS